MTARIVQLTLPEDLDAEISAAIDAGEYASAQDAISGALAEWRLARRFDLTMDRGELRRLWQAGIESGVGTGASIDQIKKEAAKRLSNG